MPAQPQPIKSVGTIDEMLLAFGGVARHRRPARFAMLPITDGRELAPWKPSVLDGWDTTEVGADLVRLDAVAPSLQQEEPASELNRIIFAARVGACVILASLARADVFKRGVNEFLNQHYPYVGRALWETRSMFSVLHAIASNPRCVQFRVTQVLHRNPINPDAPDSRIETQRLWTSRPLQDIVLDLRESRSWARSIEFQFSWKGVATGGDWQAVAASLSRNSSVVAREGVSLVWREVVLPACAAVTERRQFFADRERGSAFDKPPRPLAIEYDEDVFMGRPENELLIRQLRSLPASSLSVYHGNPYLRASIVDYLDGSSFEVWVVEPDKITIVPGARATVSASERLTAHIFENFREGNISDFA